MSATKPNINDVGGAIWKCKRNELVCLIREVGKLWKEEDEEFLEGYIVEVVSKWSDTMERLEQALICFRELRSMKDGEN